MNPLSLAQDVQRMLTFQKNLLWLLNHRDIEDSKSWVFADLARHKVDFEVEAVYCVISLAHILKFE
jgi:hypothetical protein